MNKGLKALKKASPEAYENITGQKAMYGMKNSAPMAMKGMKNMMGMGGMNMYADDGGKMPKDLIEYFERKQAEYGAKVKEMKAKLAKKGKKNEEDEEDETPELSPQEALAILAAQNPGMEVRGSSADTARSLPGGLGTTTAVSSTAAPMVGFVDPRGEVAPEQPVVVVRPEGISPMQPLKAGIPQSGLPKELMGGIREIQTPTGPKYTFEATAMAGNPTYKPDSGGVAGSGRGGLMDASGIKLVGFEDGERLPGLDAGGAAPGLFYLPEATGVPLFQSSPVNIQGGGVYGSDFRNLQSMDTGKYKNITDIYDLYGEEAYMSALAELQKKGVDIDQYDFPIEFDRPSRFDPNNPAMSSKTGFTANPADLVRSRASRSTDGRVVSGTGRPGDPAMMGGTGKMATQGSGGRGQRELLQYFERQAEKAREEFGPNSKEAKQFEDLIAQNFGSGGKVYKMGGKNYGGGGMRPMKSYGYGGKY